jgi:hypothetical protein
MKRRSVGRAVVVSRTNPRACFGVFVGALLAVPVRILGGTQPIRRGRETT